MLGWAMAAWAAPPDFDLSRLDDLAAWSAGADRLLDGPPGCHELRGHAEIRVALLTAPSRFVDAGVHELRISGPFEGTLDGGVWRRLEGALTSNDPDAEIESFPLVPMVGALGPELASAVVAEDGTASTGQSGSLSVSADDGKISVDASVLASEGLDLVEDTVERLGGNVSTIFARWSDDRGGVELVQNVPVRKDAASGPEVEMIVFFPDGGGDPAAADVVWPRTVKVPTEVPLVRVTVKDAQLHLRGGPVAPGGPVFPSHESVSLVVGVLGFTAAYEQTLTYTESRPCPAAP